MNTTIPLYQRIAFKLALLAFATALLLGVVVGLLQLKSDFDAAELQLESDIERILNVAQGSASQSVFTLNEISADELVAGLLNYEFISKVELFDEWGNLLGSGSQPAQSHPPSWLSVLIERASHDHISPLYDPGDRKRVFGQLVMSVDRIQALAPFENRAHQLLLGSVFQSLLFALVLSLLFYLLVGLPLVRITRSFNRIEPGRTMGSQLTLPGGHHQDELGRLVTVANRYIEANAELYTAQASTQCH